MNFLLKYASLPFILTPYKFSYKIFKIHILDSAKNQDGSCAPGYHCHFFKSEKVDDASKDFELKNDADRCHHGYNCYYHSEKMKFKKSAELKNETPCPPGFWCDFTRSKEIAPKGSKLKKDESCPPGYWCDSTKSEEIAPKGSKLTKDASCPPGFWCDSTKSEEIAPKDSKKDASCPPGFWCDSTKSKKRASKEFALRKDADYCHYGFQCIYHSEKMKSKKSAGVARDEGCTPGQGFLDCIEKRVQSIKDAFQSLRLQLKERDD